MALEVDLPAELVEVIQKTALDELERTSIHTSLRLQSSSTLCA